MVNDKLGKVLLVVMDRRLDRHICHLTVGEDDHWYNGFNQRGDYGPTKTGAETSRLLLQEVCFLTLQVTRV